MSRIAAAAAAAVAGVVLAGCMRVTERTTVHANGDSTVIATLAYSPHLKRNDINRELRQFKAQVERQARRSPAKVWIRPYDHPRGWRGIEAAFKLTGLTELERAETAGSNGSATFTSFIITHHVHTWTLSAKVGALVTFGKDDGAADAASLRKLLRAAGVKMVLSFKLPGRPTSSNATAATSNGTLSWDMLTLKRGSTLEATWTAP